MEIDFSMPDKVLNHKAQQLLWGYAPGHVLAALNWGVGRDELANEVLFRIWDKRQRGKKIYLRYLVMEAAEVLREQAKKKGLTFYSQGIKAPTEFKGMTVPYNDWRISQCVYR